MKIIKLALLALLASGIRAYGQEISQAMEQQLENITEQQVAIDHDEQLLQLGTLKQSPLDLNTADRDALFQLGILSALQVDNLLSYRKLLGSFINVYELQAIPMWDIATIRLVLPFITLEGRFVIKNESSQRFRYGNHQVVLRISQDFGRDTSLTTKFPGNLQQVFLRYRYSYRNLLHYGIVAEKDPGESFLKVRSVWGLIFTQLIFFCAKWASFERCQWAILQ